MRLRRKPTPKPVLQVVPGHRHVGYIRVSTAEQGDDGVSLDAQRAKLQASGVIRDVQVEIISDIASGKDMERLGLRTILDLIEQGQVGSVTVCKLDRLTRSLADLLAVIEMCRRAGVTLVSLSESLDTSTPTGKLVVHIIGAVSQWERETIAGRTVDALKYKRDAGLVAGTVPYGWDRVDAAIGEDGKPHGGRLVANAGEQAIARRIINMWSADEPLRAIAGVLNDDGVRAKRGGRWNSSSVAGVVKRRKWFANDEVMESPLL